MSGEFGLEKLLREAIAENDELRRQDEIWQHRMRDKLPAVSDRQTRPTSQRQSALTDAEIARLIDARVMSALMAFKTKITEAVGIAMAHERRDVHERIEKAISAVKFPTIKGWVPRMYAEGEIVLAGSGTYQAQRDTHQRPGHSDWACLAAPGADGEAGIAGINFDGTRGTPRGVIDIRKHNGHG